METLLPSEIARLVLGYLENQNCNEAAKMFLDTSPHLQECRIVISNGRRFSTRVGGTTLLEIIDKFFAINAIIQERLSKIADCEQLKHCRDLLEQLKFLIEETRGQRFVVNINVPTQANSQTCNGSPIVSSSARKRRHSNSDRERCKRTKVGSNASHQSESPSTRGSDSTEATPLESLPGHTETSTRQSKYVTNDKEHPKDECNNFQWEHQDRLGGDDDQDVLNMETTSAVANSLFKENNTKSSYSIEKRTAATSTEELTSCLCAQVQTNLSDTPESESDGNDEPIENLSLLTKELLNRTELQERIAENINKAILPTDISLKDETLNESVHSEGANTCTMTELNSAIKAIVEATESDPVFEKLFDEIVGPHAETDTSPDEDTAPATAEAKLETRFALDGSREKQSIINANNVSSPVEPILLVDVKSVNETNEADVPLKHRLRSSSRQQNVRVEDEQRDHEKDYSALEDQNAAAVLSIINANIANSCNNRLINDRTMAIVEATNKCTVRLDTIDDYEKRLPTLNISPIKDTQLEKSASGDDRKKVDSNCATIASIDTESKMRKSSSSVRRPRPAKLGRVPKSSVKDYTPEQDMLAIPTLVVCSREDMRNLPTSSPYPPTRPITSTSHSRFVPIVPRDPTSNKNAKTHVETLYLKTVNVFHKLPPPSHNDLTNDLGNLITCAPLQPFQAGNNCKTNDEAKSVQPLVQTLNNPIGSLIGSSVVSTVAGPIVGEPIITLYSNENGARTLLPDSCSMPTIHVEDVVNLSGTGLSPYVKFNCNKTNERVDTAADIDLIPVVENAKVVAASKPNVPQDVPCPSTSKSNDRDIINKRTPRSLLKSRSKNHRLSLSTPRRRNSHVRALDFNTPMKVVVAGSSRTNRANKANKTIGENEKVHFSPRSAKHVKSVRRTCLFKSPPFSNSGAAVASSYGVDTRLKKPRQPLQAPIATRSPLPKLMGDWEKCNGVALVLGETSPQKMNNDFLDKQVPSNSSELATSVWDADLRKSLQQTTGGENQRTKSSTGKKAAGQMRGKAVASKKAKCANSRLPRARNKNMPAKGVVDAKTERSGETQKAIESTVAENARIRTLPVDSTGPLDTRGNHVPTNNCNNTKNDSVSQTRDIGKLPGIPEEGNANNVSLTTTATTTTATTTTTDNLSLQKKNVKKYAQLKTLKTNLNKCSTEKKTSLGGEIISADTMQCLEFTQQILQMPADTIELETPRKFETTSGVPPTPRLLSPSSIDTTTPFVKINEDSSKIRSFINTPDFPKTPRIALTPKHSGETSKDMTAKKETFDSCSPYYKPTTAAEHNEHAERFKKSESGNAVQQSPTGLEQSAKQSIPHDIISPTNVYQTCVSAKLEITQFEVIKENLPKEEAVKELLISTNPRDSVCWTKLKEADCIEDDGVAGHVGENKYDGTEFCTNINDDDVHLSNGKELNDSCTSSSSCSSCSSSSSSSTSSSSTSSSSSSSSSSPSPPPSVSNHLSATNTFVKSFPIKGTCKKVPNQIYTDTSNDSAHVTETVVPESNSMIKINTRDVLCTNHAAEAIVASRKCELSPLKVFSISKNEEELNCNTKETPAKDETLLNEANISETPSSSKIGVENLPSKSFKISPFVSSADRKLLKSINSAAKKKPRIINIQRVRLNSLITLRPNSRLKSPSSVLQKQKRSLTMNEKLVLQLEAKRQRMMAKFREIPRSNPSHGKSLQRRMNFKGKNNTNTLKKSNQCKHNQRAVDQLGGNKIKVNKIKRKKKRLKEEGPDININNSNNKNDNVNSEKQVREDENDVTIRDETLTLQIARHADNGGKSDSKKVGKLSVDDVKNDDQISSACQDSKSLDAPEAEKKTRNSNVTKEESISSTLEVAGNSRVKCAAIDTAEQHTTENESNRGHNLNVKQSENNGPIAEIDSRASKSDTIRIKEHNRNEGNASKVEFSNYGSKTRSVLKLKVDQVKRDLFSDEENNYETFNLTKFSTVREDDAACNRASTTITNATITNTTSITTTTTSTTTTAVSATTTATIITTTTTTTTTATTTATTATDVAAAAIVITNINTSTTTKSPTENVDSSSPKNLSRVLQCLQLVPTCKNIYTEEPEYEHDYDRKADFNATAVPNSVEYHFLYDTNAPVKKRRRKYSSRELEFQVNIVLNEESCEECVKVMTATDYEEMINIPPKPRKRLASRKSSSSSPVKKENVCESSKRTSVGTCATNTVHTKPLATSSPIDKTLTQKTKKVAVKTCLTTERNEVQQDNKRRTKVEKCRDVDDDNSNSKSRERKLPEAKESKQVEKRPYATDPQALLSNLDLDKFLTSVHGPA